MKIFGFTLWARSERHEIREAQRAIARELRGFADDLALARANNREKMGLASAASPPQITGETASVVIPNTPRKRMKIQPARAS